MKTGDLVKLIDHNDSCGIVVDVGTFKERDELGILWKGDILVLWEDGVVRPSSKYIVELVNESR